MIGQAPKMLWERNALGLAAPAFLPTHPFCHFRFHARRDVSTRDSHLLSLASLYSATAKPWCCFNFLSLTLFFLSSTLSSSKHSRRNKPEIPKLPARTKVRILYPVLYHSTGLPYGSNMKDGSVMSDVTKQVSMYVAAALNPPRASAFSGGEASRLTRGCSTTGPKPFPGAYPPPPFSMEEDPACLPASCGTLLVRVRILWKQHPFLITPHQPADRPLSIVRTAGHSFPPYRPPFFDVLSFPCTTPLPSLAILQLQDHREAQGDDISYGSHDFEPVCPPLSWADRRPSQGVARQIPVIICPSPALKRRNHFV